MDIFYIKMGLVLFWCLWITIVFLTNIFEGLKILDVLPKSWNFESKNFITIQKTTAVYAVPDSINKLLLFGVIIWQAGLVLLFWAAFFLSLKVQGVDLGAVNLAFGLNLALWAAFMLADEIFRHYQGESSHIQIFIGQLVTLISLYIFK